MSRCTRRSDQPHTAEGGTELLEFAGTNPCVVLYGDHGEVVSAASYWSADFTPVGPGEALFLLRTGADGRAGVTAYSTGKELAAFLWSFNRFFGGFEGVPLDAINSSTAFRLDRGPDAIRLDCTSPSDAASDVVQRSPVYDFGGEAGRTYEVTSTVAAVEHGSISVNGESLPGSVVDNYGDLARSAFLAWSETWVRAGG